ncbi:hypothetical protein LPJ74_004863 [Coemansia sp. RSA 1843]|nr:hypothetical protein LPJ74_004863 [Coemansia sp. RSA 1843]
MDRQKNKDTSNFFSRIRNVDVLRSPYPRHLTSGGRVAGVAAGTRAIPASTSPNYSTARPAPVHPAPLWQTPVSRHNDLAISPTHGVSRFGGVGQIGAPQVSSYRPPAEYPNSVQPLRSRPRSFPDQRFIMPGSTLPTHLRSGNALRGISSNAQICVLHGWFACVDVEKRTVSVSGSFTKTSGKVVLRHSTPIEKAHDSRILIASTGTIYQLASAADLDLMRANGFPENLLPYFVDGFPRDWRQLIERYIASTASVGHIAGPSPRGNDGVLRSGFQQSQRRESYDGVHRRLSTERIDTITESDEDLFESRLPISPSGFSTGNNSRNSMGVYQPRGSESSSSPVNRGSVYRTGADIFAQGRFAQANSRYSSDTVDITSSSTVGGPTYLELNDDVDDTFNALDKYESEEDIGKESTPDGNGLPSHRSLEEQNKEEQEDDLSTQGTDESTVHRLGGALDDMRVEKESLVPLHSSSDHNGGSVSKGTIATRNKGQQQQIGENNNPDGKENEASTDKDLSGIQERRKDTPTRKPRGAKQQRPMSSKRGARRIIETSDDSCQLSAEGVSNDESDNEPLSTKMVPSTANRTPFSSRRISGQRSATVTRSTRRTTLLETPTKPALRVKTPNSAPSGRIRRNKADISDKKTSERQQGKGANPRDKSTAAKPGEVYDSSSDFASEKRSSSAAENWNVKVDPASPEEDLDIDESTTKTSSELNTPSKGSKDNGSAALSKTPSDLSMTTPKRKKGRNYFRYKELPGPSISVTRSGRKVRRPNEWWANAQEHLSTGHKESDIKYKWGTGDPVLVKGDKRVKLSDYYKQSDGADLRTDDQSSESADEIDNLADNSDDDLAATSIKTLDGSSK